jgi:hypothetical protein
MGAMRPCLNEIMPEFQEGSLGGGKNAAENILHYMWSFNLGLRPKTSALNVVFNEVQRLVVKVR